MSSEPEWIETPLPTAAVAIGEAAPTFRTRLVQIPAIVALAERSFQAFWIAAVLAAAEQQLRIMAQSWLILDKGASQIWVGLAVGIPAIPAVPLVLMSGVLSDSRGAKFTFLMARAGVLCAAAGMAAIVLIGYPPLWPLIVLAILAAAAYAFGFGPTQTLVPTLVRRQHLQAANALNSVGFSMAKAVGPLVGGLLIAALGIGSPFLALCALSAGAIFFALRIREPQELQTAAGSPWQKIREGLDYARENPTVRWLLVLGMFLLAAFTWLAVLPVYARDVLHVGEHGYAAMLAMFAVGQAVSGLYVAVSGGFRRKGVAVVVSAVIWSISGIVFGYSHSYPVSLCAMFALGIVPPIWLSSLLTLLQVTTPADKVGRIMSLFALTVQVAQLSWLIGTGLGQLIGNPMMLAITMSIFAVTNLLALARSPELRAKT